MENEKILRFLYLQKSRKTLTLIDGTVIKGGETFESLKSNIPSGFMDLVKVIGSAETPAGKKANEPAMIRNKKPAVIELDETNEVEAGTEEAIDEQIEEIVTDKTIEVETENKTPKPVFTFKHAGGGKYNVLDADGKVVNDKLLTKAAAVLMIDDLQA